MDLSEKSPFFIAVTAVNSFLQYLRTERRMSNHTLISYSTDLKQFADYLQLTYEELEPERASALMIRSWMVSLTESGISNRSIRRKLSSLKSFYSFQIKQGKLEGNPLTGIISPKISKRLPVYVEERSMAELEVKPDYPAGLEGMRDALMLSIFYETGVRLSELISLRERDVDFSRGFMKVLGKRNKERIVPVSQELINQISVYVTEKAKLAYTESEFLLTTDAGKKLYPKFVQRKVNYYLGEVSTLEKRSPHVLRHTFATHMLNNGADLNAIKEILGHANLAATQVYTHNSIDKLKQVHRLTHPRG